MKIEMEYRRQDPKNPMSKIIYRGLRFETPLRVECIEKIADKIHLDKHYIEFGCPIVEEKMTIFRIDLTKEVSPTCLMFLYDIINWESNSHHING